MNKKFNYVIIIIWLTVFVITGCNPKRTAVQKSGNTEVTANIGEPMNEPTHIPELVAPTDDPAYVTMPSDIKKIYDWHGEFDDQDNKAIYSFVQIWENSKKFIAERITFTANLYAADGRVLKTNDYYLSLGLGASGLISFEMTNDTGSKVAKADVVITNVDWNSPKEKAVPLQIDVTYPQTAITESGTRVVQTLVTNKSDYAISGLKSTYLFLDPDKKPLFILTGSDSGDKLDFGKQTLLSAWIWPSWINREIGNGLEALMRQDFQYPLIYWVNYQTPENEIITQSGESTLSLASLFEPKVATSLTIKPFDYQLKELGDGWNEGRITLAFENNSTELFKYSGSMDYLPLLNEREPVISLETAEGQQYPVTILNEHNNGGFNNNLVIPPGFRFSADGRTFFLEWKSAVTVTPTKIVFQDYPEYNFTLPVAKTLNFPYDTPPTEITSVSALKDTYLINDIQGITTVFTGRCGTPRWFSSESSSSDKMEYLFIELESTNNDPYQEKTTNFPKTMFDVFSFDGNMGYYNGLYFILFPDADHTYDDKISLGPGQTETGYLGINVPYHNEPINKLPVTVIFSEDGSFKVIDLSECGFIQ